MIQMEIEIFLLIVAQMEMIQGIMVVQIIIQETIMVKIVEIQIVIKMQSL